MLLSTTLDYLKDKNLAKESYGNSSYGFTATAPIKSLIRRHVRDYLLKPHELFVQTTEGEETQVTVSNIKRICFRALLKELSM